ncbi:hypothetical protein AVJ23_11790 [Pseudoponticoccus marisrubri]|uniref:Uncharacterized protein n=2 Tax=Pseudoponticoccus marisrubri TaxID=1685382 RepID=A0A0W7WJ14_9RHOB|nr:hypothetical protein AVJ23_11790 [Pseudoponticoccus marisrubri]
MAFLFGSVLGFFSGLVGWLFMDMSALTAFSLYLSVSFACSALAMASRIARRGFDAPLPE